MEKDLLKRIAQYVICNKKVPTQIEGYADEAVVNAVDDMIDKKIILFGKATEYSPKEGTYTIREGDSIPLKSGHQIDVAIISEYKFKKAYGIEWF